MFMDTTPPFRLQHYSVNDDKVIGITGSFKTAMEASLHLLEIKSSLSKAGIDAYFNGIGDLVIAKPGKEIIISISQV